MTTPTKTISAKDVWVIIPGLNEEKYLASVLKKVLQFTPNVVFVDDGSSDKTSTIAHKYLEHVLIHQINLGKGAALKTGCEYAFKQLQAGAVIFMDSDDQHDPKEIQRFVKAFAEGNEVVFGVRKFSSASMPILRFLGNKSISVLINVLYGSYVPDIPSGYKGLTKKAYQAVRWTSLGYEVETEIAAKVAKAKIPYKVLEIETIYHDTEKGMNGIEALKILLSLLQWRIGL